MILVRLRCAKCRRVLRALHEPLASGERISWARCQRCEFPRPERLMDVMDSKGVDRLPAAGSLSADDLKPAFERAQLTGRTQDVPVRVLDR